METLVENRLAEFEEPHSNGELRLAIGNVAADGFVLVPIEQSTKLHYETGSVSEIRISRTLERFPHALAANAMAEWMRVLKEYGRIIISVTDFDKVCAIYAGKQSSKFDIDELLFGRQGDTGEIFGSCYNESKIRAMLHAVGGRAVTRIPSGDSVALVMQAEKARRYKCAGVGGVMSMPRLSFTDCDTQVMNVVLKFGIPFGRRQGVNWGQTMTRALEYLTDDAKYEFALTVDFDTLFTEDDVEELYRIMREHPDVDAVAGLQMIRELDTPIVTIRKNQTENKDRILRSELHADLMRISTAHFGLTMLRLDKLRKLPRPWFVHVPDSDGRWEGKDRIDDDINFWRKWEAAGNTLYQANLVRLGHMELVAKWPDANLRPIYQGMNEYRTDGKPLAVSQW